MPPTVNKKKRRISKNQKEDGNENQSKLLGFKTSIIRPIIDPELKTQDIKSEKYSNNDEKVSKLLNDFDLDHSFGPCSEISRYQRLERAKKFSIPLDSSIEKMINDHCKDCNSEISVSIIDKLMKHYAD